MNERNQKSKTPRRGALLLEVILALTIMIATMGMLGTQLINGLRMTEFGQEQTRASQLVNRMMTLLELDLETVARFFDERTIDGDFGEQYPGWFWRATVDETDTLGLGLVTIEVLHQADPDRQDSIDDARLVRQMHLLKADPGRIDLAADFGLSEERIAQFAESIPIPGFDPASLNPQELVSLDPAMLLDLLPQLMALFQQLTGGRLPSELSGLAPDAIGDLLGGVGRPPGISPGGAAGVGGDNPTQAAIRALLESQLGGQLSQQELDDLLSQVGANTGGNRRGGDGGGRGGRTGGRRNGGGRQPQSINDFNDQRNGRGGRP